MTLIKSTLECNILYFSKESITLTRSKGTYFGDLQLKRGNYITLIGHCDSALNTKVGLVSPKSMIKISFMLLISRGYFSLTLTSCEPILSLINIVLEYPITPHLILGIIF